MMRVLLLQSEPNEVRRQGDLLVARGHEVARALPLAPGWAPDVVLTDIRSLGADPKASLAKIRGLGRGSPFVVLVLPKVDATSMASATALGVEDVLRFGAIREELVARVEAPLRLKAWGSSTTGGSGQEFGSFQIGNLRAWAELEGIIATEIGQMFGWTSVVTAAGADTAVAFAAEIPLSIPAERLEVRLAVGLSMSGAAALGEAVLGGAATVDAMHDALREVANTVGGALKRAALSEGATFSLGLPISRAPFTCAGASRAWVVKTDAGAQFVLSAVYVIRENKKVKARDLREGMVLAHDVKNAAGVVLITAGATLTERTVERLIEVVGPGAAVEVGEPHGADALAA